jgi:hypothetical protein
MGWGNNNPPPPKPNHPCPPNNPHCGDYIAPGVPIDMWIWILIGFTVAILIALYFTVGIKTIKSWFVKTKSWETKNI